MVEWLFLFVWFVLVVLVKEYVGIVKVLVVFCKMFWNFGF